MVLLYSFPNNLEIQSAKLPKPRELAINIFLQDLKQEYAIVYYVYLQGKAILSNFTYDELRELPLNKDSVPVNIEWQGETYQFNLIKKVRTNPPHTPIFEIRIDDRIMHENPRRGVKYFRIFFFPDQNEGLDSKICLYDYLEKEAVDLADFNRANIGNKETNVKIKNGLVVQKCFRSKRDLFDVYLR
ncbi:hypothetical protein QIX46_17960 [Lysinibacillus boronitolerans]|nr:hypothetical protein QIX46_17960 [Lysinibacillus boronitolerans]